MIDFEQLRAERQTLSEKIEERNNDLAKLSLRCFSDTQILSHVHQKDFNLNHQIYTDEINVETAYDKLIETRKYANDMKLKRDYYRKNYSDMSESCGLLNKKKLLQDYDATVNEIENEENLVNDLKKDIIRLENEYINVMKQIDATKLHKTDSQIFDEKLANKVKEINRPILPRIRKGIINSQRLHFFLCIIYTFVSF